MNGRDDRIEDVRPTPLIRIDAAAFDLIPTLGPVSWTVYTYLVYRASRPGGVWPQTEEVARACGVSLEDVQTSIAALIDHGVIGRHKWTAHPNQPTTYTILPITESGPSPSVSPSWKPEPQDAKEEDDDVVVETDTEEADLVAEKLQIGEEGTEQVDTAWFEQAREKRLSRRLFSSFVSALGGEPTDLNEADRDRIRRATEIVTEAGGTPDQVRDLTERINSLQPDAQVDPVWIAEHWEELTRDLPSKDDENI